MPNLFERRPKPQGRHTPNLWPVWAVAPLALIVVGALAYGLYRGVDALLAAENTSKNPVDVQDVIKTAVTVITLIGAVLAGLYAYRKQLLSEGDSHRADASQLAERYAQAAEQLGHDQAAVRLAGVYAMARLADDWPEQRQVCIDVLCAYLRMPYEADPTEDGFMKGEREVRFTIIRTIRDHLQDPESVTSWCGFDLDFTGATFDGGDFKGVAFTSGLVSFSGAAFIDGAVDFLGATFSGATVVFADATFSGGEVFFVKVRFSGGWVAFSAAQFSDGRVSFSGSTFSGGEVAFPGAKFSGGEVAFLDAKFSGGEVYFLGSVFSGGKVDFFGARFSGGRVDFDRVELDGGEVGFASVHVHSTASIEWGPFPAIPVNQP